MSAALALPYVWAESETVETETSGDGIAFYRKRTEELLQRYIAVSLQTGRLPAALSNCVVRGKASHYRMHSFEDAIIFLLDIEKCLKQLDRFEQEMIARIALQEYTQEEAARLLKLGVKTVRRRYPEILDRLSRIFLEFELLERS
jgi:DNA-directed RNA polymerase specialized sigma24 family protein